MSHCILPCVAIKVNSPQRSRSVAPFWYGGGGGPIIKVNRVTGNGPLDALVDKKSLSLVLYLYLPLSIEGTHSIRFVNLLYDPPNVSFGYTRRPKELRCYEEFSYVHLEILTKYINTLLLILGILIILSESE